jgi:hypothetical protein
LEDELVKRNLFVGILQLGALFGASTNAAADVLFESSTLGPTGVSWDDVQKQLVLGTRISTFAYNGVRFELSEPSVTNGIGGHFVSSGNGTFFGALISLSSETDFPDSGDLTTPDVLGHTILNFPSPSSEVFGDLDLKLLPGWYGLVFGSGLFGASSDGAAVRNGVDIENPSYIAFQRLSPFGWVNLTTFANQRFVVQGMPVPEPAVLSTVPLTFVLVFVHRRRNRR